MAVGGFWSQGRTAHNVIDRMFVSRPKSYVETYSPGHWFQEVGSMRGDPIYGSMGSMSGIIAFIKETPAPLSVGKFLCLHSGHCKEMVCATEEINTRENRWENPCVLRVPLKIPETHDP